MAEKTPKSKEEIELENLQKIVADRAKTIGKKETDVHKTTIELNKLKREEKKENPPEKIAEEALEALKNEMINARNEYGTKKVNYDKTVSGIKSAMHKLGSFLGLPKNQNYDIVHKAEQVYYDKARTYLDAFTDNLQAEHLEKTFGSDEDKAKSRAEVDQKVAQEEALYKKLRFDKKDDMFQESTEQRADAMDAKDIAEGKEPKKGNFLKNLWAGLRSGAKKGITEGMDGEAPVDGENEEEKGKKKKKGKEELPPVRIPEAELETLRGEIDALRADYNVKQFTYDQKNNLITRFTGRLFNALGVNTDYKEVDEAKEAYFEKAKEYVEKFTSDKKAQHLEQTFETEDAQITSRMLTEDAIEAEVAKFKKLKFEKASEEYQKMLDERHANLEKKDAEAGTPGKRPGVLLKALGVVGRTLGTGMDFYKAMGDWGFNIYTMRDKSNLPSKEEIDALLADAKTNKDEAKRLKGEARNATGADKENLERDAEVLEKTAKTLEEQAKGKIVFQYKFGQLVRNLGFGALTGVGFVSVASVGTRIIRGVAIQMISSKVINNLEKKNAVQMIAFEEQRAEIEQKFAQDQNEEEHNHALRLLDEAISKVKSRHGYKRFAVLGLSMLANYGSAKLGGDALLEKGIDYTKSGILGMFSGDTGEATPTETTTTETEETKTPEKTNKPVGPRLKDTAQAVDPDTGKLIPNPVTIQDSTATDSLNSGIGGQDTTSTDTIKSGIGAQDSTLNDTLKNPIAGQDTTVQDTLKNIKNGIGSKDTIGYDTTQVIKPIINQDTTGYDTTQVIKPIMNGQDTTGYDTTKIIKPIISQDTTGYDTTQVAKPIISGQDSTSVDPTNTGGTKLEQDAGSNPDNATEDLPPHKAIEPIKVSSEGAGAMIQDLKQALEKEYPDPATRPENIDHIIKTPLWTLAQEWGMFNPENAKESMFVLEGSTISVDENGVVSIHDIGKGDDTIISGENNVKWHEGRMFDSDHSGARASESGAGVKGTESTESGSGSGDPLDYTPPDESEFYQDGAENNTEGESAPLEETQKPSTSTWEDLNKQESNVDNFHQGSNFYTEGSTNTSPDIDRPLKTINPADVPGTPEYTASHPPVPQGDPFENTPQFKQENLKLINEIFSDRTNGISDENGLFTESWRKLKDLKIIDVVDRGSQYPIYVQDEIDKIVKLNYETGVPYGGKTVEEYLASVAKNKLGK